MGLPQAVSMPQGRVGFGVLGLVACIASRIRAQVLGSGGGVYAESRSSFGSGRNRRGPGVVVKLVLLVWMTAAGVAVCLPRCRRC